MLTEEEQMLLDSYRPNSDGDLPSRMKPNDSDDSYVMRGLDTLQALGGSAVQAAGEIIGSESMAEMGRNFKLEQMAEANEEAPMPETVFQGVKEAVPTIGTVLGAGAIGLAATGGNPVGGLIGLGLGSFGLNLGFIKDIEEQLDPTSKSNLTTLLGAASATSIDVLAGGAFTSAAKAPLKQAIKQSLMKEAGKGLAIGAGAGAAGMGVLDITASASTDTGFDMDRVEAIAGNMATAGIVGGVIGLGASAGTHGFNAMRASQEAFDQAHKPRYRYNNDTEKWVLMDSGIANPEYARNPTLLKKWGQRVLDRSTGELDWMRNNPAGKDLLDGIHQNNRDMVNAKQMTHGMRAEQIVNDELPSLTKLARMSDAEQKAAAMDVATGNMNSEGANLVRGVTDKLLNLGRKAGLEIKELPNYLPFTPDIKKIMANIGDFEKEVREAVAKKLSGSELKVWNANFEEYMGNLQHGGARVMGGVLENDKLIKILESARLGDADPVVSKGAVRKLQQIARGNTDTLKTKRNNNLEMERFLKDVPQEILERWQKKIPLADRIRDYVTINAERIAHAEKFGVDGEILHSKMAKVILEQKALGTPIAAEDVARVYNIVNAMQRQYKTSKLTDQTRRLIQNARAVQTVRTLPMGTVASLGEPLLIIDRVGMKSGLTGLGQAVSDTAEHMARRVLGKLPKGSLAEREAFLDSVGVSQLQAVHDAAMRVDSDGAIRLSGVESKFLKATLLPQWTEWNRKAAAYAAEDAIKDAIKVLIKGESLNKTNKAFKKLAQAGIDPAEAVNWYKANGLADGVSKGRNAANYQNIRTGVMNLVNDVVLRPDATNRGLWMSDPRLALASQLKGWPTVFGNTIMNRWYKNLLDNGVVNNMQEATRLAGFVSMYASSLVGIAVLKDIARDGENNFDEKDMEQVIADTISAFGPTGFLLDPVRSQGLGSSMWAAIGGPTVSHIEQVNKQVFRMLNGNSSPEDAIKGVIKASTPSVPLNAHVKELIEDI